MNNNISEHIFPNTVAGQSGTIRCIAIDNTPWFVASDVCAILGLKNTSLATSKLDDDEKGISNAYTLGGNQSVVCVNESGLYSLIFKSRRAEARGFRKWVTNVVLPSIRKHGGYITAQSSLSETAIAAMHKHINDQLAPALAYYERETRHSFYKINGKGGDWCIPIVAKQFDLPISVVTALVK